jgi:hypothetical protein
MSLPNLSERVRRLSNLDRVQIIDALIGIDAQMQAIARRGTRAKRDSPARYRADEALSQVGRLGRIIYFLRFRTPATGITDDDLILCDMLAEKLRAKGQWEGEHSQ